MRRIISQGLLVFAGAMTAPTGVMQHLAGDVSAAGYRVDTRLNTLRTFFASGDCPAERFSQEFLHAADTYGLDWRLLPSISFIESTGGKNLRKNNLFGWNSGKAEFSSPRAAIYRVAYLLTNSDLYRNKGVDGILQTYNPNRDYARKVKSVMRRISPSE
jgi:hypothetical protein